MGTIPLQADEGALPFTDDEKARIRHFLRYPSWGQLGPILALGLPAGAQPLFVVESSFGKLLPDGRQAVRRDLCECESIEAQLRDARTRFKASQAGEVRLNPKEPQMLREELEYWGRRLADDLGVPFNPYSQMSYLGMPGGINARVVG